MCVCVCVCVCARPARLCVCTERGVRDGREVGVAEWALPEFSSPARVTVKTHTYSLSLSLSLSLSEVTLGSSRA